MIIFVFYSGKTLLFLLSPFTCRPTSPSTWTMSFPPLPEKASFPLVRSPFLLGFNLNMPPSIASPPPAFPFLSRPSVFDTVRSRQLFNTSTDFPRLGSPNRDLGSYGHNFELVTLSSFIHPPTFPPHPFCMKKRADNRGALLFLKRVFSPESLSFFFPPRCLWSLVRVPSPFLRWIPLFAALTALFFKRARSVLSPVLWHLVILLIFSTAVAQRFFVLYFRTHFFRPRPLSW